MFGTYVDPHDQDAYFEPMLSQTALMDPRHQLHMENTLSSHPSLYMPHMGTLNSQQMSQQHLSYLPNRQEFTQPMMNQWVNGQVNPKLLAYSPSYR